MRNKLIIIFLFALILRLALVNTAFHGDLNNNISWAKSVVERGTPDFYEGKFWAYSAPNQPPLTILMFGGSRVIWTFIEDISWQINNSVGAFPSSFIWYWESSGMTLLVKLPSILADLGIGWLIYKYFRQKKKEKEGLILAAVWLFNPITWYNSAIWGQTDSIVNLLGMVGILAILKKRFLAFSIFFTLSVLFKGSLSLFIPIVLIVAIKQKYNLNQWLKAAGASIITVILVSVWFHPKFDLFIWLFNLYKDRILPGEIGYLTANAFNLWWLVDPGRILDSTLYLGLPARAWGILIAVGGIFGVSYWLYKKVSDKRVFASTVIITLLAFLFMTRIHERYMYPLFPYATMLLGLIPGMIIPYTVLSLTYLLNMYHLFWAPPIPVLETVYQNSIFTQLIIVVNLVVFFYILRLFRRVKV